MSVCTETRGIQVYKSQKATLLVIDFAIFEKTKAIKLSHRLGMSGNLTVTDFQSSHVHHKGCSHYKVRAKTSYVDETLFGHSNELQSSMAESEPPWSSTSRTDARHPLLWSPSSQIRPSATGEIGPVPNPSKCGSTPVKKNKHRLKCQMPSYCDETLFGSKREDAGWEAPWTVQEDKIKMRPLLWTPSVHKISSNESCSRSVQFSFAKGNTVKPPYSNTRESCHNFITEYRGKADYWKRPNSDNDSANDTPVRAQPQSLTRIPSSRKIVKVDSRNTKQLQYRPISALTSHSGPQHYNKQKPGNRSDSVSRSQSKPTSSVILNPPWKY